MTKIRLLIGPWRVCKNEWKNAALQLVSEVVKKLWLFIRFYAGKKDCLAIFEVSRTGKTA